MVTDDTEVVGSFEPGPARCVLVLAFDDLGDMLLAQDRLTRQMCGWTDQGERYDRVETVLMADYVAAGRRPMAEGRLDGTLLVAAADSAARTEQARRQWASKDKVHERLELAKVPLADAMAPTPDQVDLFDKWEQECIELHPAGGEGAPAVKLTFVRNAFNVFVRDHGRADLQFLGSSGGRAFSALLRSRFREEAQIVPASNNRVYLRGLRRKSGANPAWFPNLVGQIAS